MERLELLKKVLSDYCAQNEELKFQESILAHFCDYAAEWFKTHGVIGLGHTAEGMALRLTDGSEYALFSPDSVSGALNPVSITGAAAKIEKPTNDFTRSFPITGR